MFATCCTVACSPYCQGLIAFQESRIKMIHQIKRYPHIQFRFHWNKNRMIKGIYIVMLIAVYPSIGIAQSQEENQVRHAFDKYKKAILNDRGAEAVACVDSSTILYYNRMLDLARHADSATIENAGLFDKFMVLAIRQRTSREEIMRLDGRGLLQFAIESGMVGKNSVAGNSIGAVEIDRHFAKGQLVTNGETTDVYFDFNKENGQWKIDITSVFEISEKVIREMYLQSGQSENEYLISLLEMVSGSKAGPEIWLPVE